MFAPPPDGPRELKYLEQLTHPRDRQTGSRAGRRTAARQARPRRSCWTCRCCSKSGWNKFCDKIVFVDAPREHATGAGARREVGPRRILPVVRPPRNRWKSKRELADVVIDNSGSLRVDRKLKSSDFGNRWSIPPLRSDLQVIQRHMTIVQSRPAASRCALNRTRSSATSRNPRQRVNRDWATATYPTVTIHSLFDGIPSTRR